MPVLAVVTDSRALGSVTMCATIDLPGDTEGLLALFCGDNPKLIEWALEPETGQLTIWGG